MSGEDITIGMGPSLLLLETLENLYDVMCFLAIVVVYIGTSENCCLHECPVAHVTDRSAIYFGIPSAFGRLHQRQQAV